jgi:hypothetical protein
LKEADEKEIIEVVGESKGKIIIDHFKKQS